MPLTKPVTNTFVPSGLVAMAVASSKLPAGPSCWRAQAGVLLRGEPASTVSAGPVTKRIVASRAPPATRTRTARLPRIRPESTAVCVGQQAGDCDGRVTVGVDAWGPGWAIVAPIVNEASEFLVKHGPLVLFVWVLAEQLGLPIPALPALLAAGALARSVGMNPFPALAAALLASLLADTLWYEIGRRGGGKVMNFLCRVSLEPDSCVRKPEDLLSRHGARSLLVAKFVPGLSTAAPPLAGIFRMRFSRFLLFNSIGAVIWAGGTILVGYLLGNQLEAIVAGVARAGHLVTLVLAGLALYVLAKWINRRRFLRKI